LFKVGSPFLFPHFFISPGSNGRSPFDEIIPTVQFYHIDYLLLRF
jgi:hypothetical protein